MHRLCAGRSIRWTPDWNHPWRSRSRVSLAGHNTWWQIVTLTAFTLKVQGLKCASNICGSINLPMPWLSKNLWPHTFAMTNLHTGTCIWPDVLCPSNKLLMSWRHGQLQNVPITVQQAIYNIHHGPKELTDVHVKKRSYEILQIGGKIVYKAIMESGVNVNPFKIITNFRDPSMDLPLCQRTFGCNKPLMFPELIPQKGKHI